MMEAHEAKAGMSFLLHCFAYCNVPIPEGQFTYFCNNKGLLKKFQSLRSYNNAITSTMLYLEWDLVSSIHGLQQQFCPPPDLQHVKGHQDNGVHVDLLDLPIQLNVEVDTLAMCELQEYGSVKPTVPFDPETGVHFGLDGRTVMHHLCAAIHNQQHLAPLHAYYCTHFHRDDYFFDGIDWPTFAMVYKRFPCQGTFYTSKFLLLPRRKKDQLHPLALLAGHIHTIDK
jgi:hypothetical protein